MYVSGYVFVRCLKWNLRATIGMPWTWCLRALSCSATYKTCVQKNHNEAASGTHPSYSMTSYKHCRLVCITDMRMTELTYPGSSLALHSYSRRNTVTSQTTVHRGHNMAPARPCRFQLHGRYSESWRGWTAAISVEENRTKWVEFTPVGSLYCFIQDEDSRYKKFI